MSVLKKTTSTDGIWIILPKMAVKPQIKTSKCMVRYGRELDTYRGMVLYIRMPTPLKKILGIQIANMG